MRTYEITADEAQALLAAGVRVFLSLGLTRRLLIRDPGVIERFADFDRVFSTDVEDAEE